jgi:hypothetical protein
MKADMGTLFSRWETLLIAVALIVPESLRSFSPTLEPYPAVILPAGAGTIRINDGTVRARRTFLTAKRNGEWEEVDLAEFLAPVADHYLGRIVKRDFGFPRRKHASPLKLAQVEETKRWMRSKLAAQGFETHELSLMEQSMTITLATGKQSRSKTSRKKTYDLD